MTCNKRQRCGDKIREGAVKDSERQIDKKRNTRKLGPITPLYQREALHLSNICPPKSSHFGLSASRLPLFTSRSYRQCVRLAQSQTNTQTDTATKTLLCCLCGYTYKSPDRCVYPHRQTHKPSRGEEESYQLSTYSMQKTGDSAGHTHTHTRTHTHTQLQLAVVSL